MKNLRGTTETEHRTRSSFKQLLAGSLTTLALLGAPMMEGRAHAQQPQSQEERRTVTTDVSGQGFQLNGPNSTRLSVYQVSEQQGRAPSVTIEGPATLRVRFYPLLPRSSVDQSGSLEYNLDY